MIFPSEADMYPGSAAFRDASLQGEQQRERGDAATMAPRLSGGPIRTPRRRCERSAEIPDWPALSSVTPSAHYEADHRQLRQLLTWCCHDGAAPAKLADPSTSQEV